MKIVVLDGYTTNPGDLSWQSLRKLGDLTVYERSSEESILERSRDADVLFTNKSLISGDTLRCTSRLKYIGVLATGYNNIDIQTARKLKIPVCNVLGYGNMSVSQMVMAHILNYTQRVAEHSNGVHSGDWGRAQDFCYWKYPLIELNGLTMGIIGLGDIGKTTAKLAQAFGMKVIACVRNRNKIPPEGVKWLDLDKLLTESDFISLHCPLTSETKHIINEITLKRMKATAFLVNTGRGPLIDEQALANALNENRLGGAGIDVLSEEPPQNLSPLYNAKNCYITPHIAWATLASRKRLIQMAVGNLESFLRGELKNCVYT